jgi:azurin
MRWILGTVLAAGAAFANPAWSQECAATIEGNDQIQFVQKTLTVSTSCDTFTLTLKHIGTLGATIMGHNWVLTTTADYQAVAQQQRSSTTGSRARSSPENPRAPPLSTTPPAASCSVR